MTVSNQIRALKVRLKSELLPNNCRDWTIEAGMNDFMTRRTALLADFTSNCGPVRHGLPAKTFTDQLEIEIGDIGDLVAMRYALSGWTG